MEKIKNNSSRKTSVYSPVILNSKTKDVVFGLFDRLKVHGKNAGIGVDKFEISIKLRDGGDIDYELSFEYCVKMKKTLYSKSIEDFDMEFIKFLFTIK